MGCESSTETRENRSTLEHELEETREELRRMRQEARMAELRQRHAGMAGSEPERGSQPQVGSAVDRSDTKDVNAFSVERLAELAELLECPVCMETYNDQDRIPVTFKCGHSTCINHVPMLQGKCPKCRQSIPSDASTIFPAYALKAASATLLTMQAAAHAAQEEAEAQAALRLAEIALVDGTEGNSSSSGGAGSSRVGDIPPPTAGGLDGLRTFSEFLLDGHFSPTLHRDGTFVLRQYSTQSAASSTPGQPPLVVPVATNVDATFDLLVGRLHRMAHTTTSAREAGLMLSHPSCTRCRKVGCGRTSPSQGRQTCCACADTRPRLDHYLIYRGPTQGWQTNGSREESYCSQCRL